MDEVFRVGGVAFVWNRGKAAANVRRHGISFAEKEGTMKASELRDRLRNDRPMTTMTMRIPEDVVEDLKKVAPRLGFSGYQPLIRAYIGQGLRADLARLEGTDPAVIADILRRHGVADDVIEIVLAEFGAADRSP